MMLCLTVDCIRPIARIAAHTRAELDRPPSMRRYTAATGE